MVGLDQVLWIFFIWSPCWFWHYWWTLWG